MCEVTPEARRLEHVMCLESEERSTPVTHTRTVIIHQFIGHHDWFRDGPVTQLHEAAAPPSCWNRLGSRPPRKQGVRPPSSALRFSHGALGHAQRRSPRPLRSPAPPPWALGSSAAAPERSPRAQGTRGWRRSPPSLLPTPRAPPAPPPHTPLPSALRRVARHLGREFVAAPPQSPRPAEHERRRCPSPGAAAAISAFRLCWTPAPRWDPLLSPPPPTATFPALGSWRSGALGRVRPARSSRATADWESGDDPAAPPEGPALARGWREGRRGLSVPRAGDQEAAEARRVGARV
ncbi:atherin-like [Ailuropoda melanoleuca]|uniref:atherin-like n=1 Tax=Ailuropoda melanoleuca TaxID=9646 RepID=UPI00149486C4|nr:atherin-like [Ailuropoda melanoleuca]